MKKMKKMLAALLAMAMVLAMSASALAATITIEGGAAGSEYAAYKLLNATYSAGETESDDDDKYAYTLNEKYTAVLTTVTGKATQEEIVAYIEAHDTAEEIRIFADSLYEAIKENELAADYKTTTDVFTNVDQGYYLIEETKTSGTADTYSLVILDTAGKDEIKVTTKEDAPTLEKKVKETNDSTGEVSEWQDGADYDIGDTVPFKLTGTVSEKYDDYNKYYYAFHDVMSAGLTFMPETVVVKVDETGISEGYRVVTEELTDGCTFEVIFDDLKEITTVTKDSSITVEFSAKLNENAQIGSAGNPNEAKLEYSNNPYDDAEGKPETGETPFDKVIVFTYILNADKIDGKTNEPLEGAEFTLYKYNAETKAYEAVGETIKEGTKFTFNGLDAGQYKLEETKAPEGYNKADDLFFTIEASYDTESSDPKLTGLVVKDAEGEVISEGEDAVFEYDLTAGSINTTVKNFVGFVLPSTGGIGTTIFYIAGAVLVIGAVIVFVTRKRMDV